MATRTPLVFIVENGTGLPDATSYVSVEEADQIMDRVPDQYKSGWLEMDEYQKQQVLIWGTQIFDDYVYFPCHPNQKVSQAQALNFPRYGIYNQDGYQIPTNEVPDFVKRATVQLGFELGATNLLSEPVRGITSATVGPLSVTFAENYASQTRVIPRSIGGIVAPYCGVIRGTSSATGLRAIPLYRG